MVRIVLAQTSWTNGTPTGSTWINTYGTNGKNVADLDLGTANTSGKRIIIGNLINNAASYLIQTRWFCSVIFIL
jgi:hypothetical protein